VRGDDALFERISLEAFQSGLSWLTILRKREHFRSAFAGFSIERVAAFATPTSSGLMADAGIVRNRMKIEADAANARAALALREAGDGLSDLIWRHAPPPRPAPRTAPTSPAQTDASRALATDLKRHGCRFVGPTTAYAAMQACGLSDDHLEGCVARRS
jgi:DNA-3-methyladenine glycosylase I